MQEPGLTKSEQWALIALAGLIFAGTLVRLWPGAAGSGDIWIEAGPAWEPVPGASAATERRGEGSSLEAEASANRPGAVSEDVLGDLSGPSPAKSGKVDLNSADARALEGLPGIGKVKAQAIVDFRRVSGPFTTLEALDEVPGIGPKTIQNLQPYAEVFAQTPGGGNPSRAGDKPSAGGGAALPMEEVRASEASGKGEVPGKTQASSRIDINRASYDELLDIPGIGPVLAGRIIESRRAHSFRKPSELIRIKGIGPTSYESMEKYVRVGP